MSVGADLWVITYEQAAAAEAASAAILSMQSKHLVNVPDVVLVTCKPDGSCAVKRENLAGARMAGFSITGLLTGLVLMQPLLGGAVGAALGIAGVAATQGSVINDAFVRQVHKLIKPGTSALILLCSMTDKDVLLPSIQGLGGKVLTTTVDLEWAQQIQATLEAARPR